MKNVSLLFCSQNASTQSWSPKPISTTSSSTAASASTPSSSAPPALALDPLNYRELSDVDDACTAALVDPILGFTSHKMARRFFNPSTRDQKVLSGIVQDFKQHQDYERAWKDLGEVDWWRGVLNKRKKNWEAMLKDHVRARSHYVTDMHML